MANRPGAAGFVNLDVTGVTTGAQPRDGLGGAPHLNTTSFEDPQSDTHEVTTDGLSDLMRSTHKENCLERETGPTPSTASQMIQQTSGQRPSIHRLSNKDGRLTTPISPRLETRHHGSKTEPRMP
jgi:hypothetical protein